MRLSEKYRRYKKSYIKLFAVMCDAIDVIEELLPKLDDEDAKKLLTAQVERFKSVHQLTEKIIISD